jgi:hypothetical protein
VAGQPNGIFDTRLAGSLFQTTFLLPVRFVGHPKRLFRGLSASTPAERDAKFWDPSGFPEIRSVFLVTGRFPGKNDVFFGRPDKLLEKQIYILGCGPNALPKSRNFGLPAKRPKKST